MSNESPVLLLDRDSRSRRLGTRLTGEQIIDLGIPTSHRRNYILQARDSLTEDDWQNVQTLPGNGHLRHFDPQSIGGGDRYYRIELQETFGPEL